MSKHAPLSALISASHMDRIEQDARRGIGASSGDPLRLVGELARFIRDPLTIESHWVNAMFNIIEDQNATFGQLEAEHVGLLETVLCGANELGLPAEAGAQQVVDALHALQAEKGRLTKQVAVLQSDANSWQSGYDEGRRMGTKTALSERDSFRRLAGFWRSPKEIPAEGAPVVVLRDAGTVGNGQHPGHRTGRWLELTTAWPTMFVCDVLSTGRVIGWVGTDEFNGLIAIVRNAERYQVLRQADIDTIHNGGLFAGLTPDNIVINGSDLDQRTDAVIDSHKAAPDE